MFAPVGLVLLAAAPQLALLSTPANAGYSELRFQPIDAREPVKPVLRFSHVSEESVLGAVVPGRRAVVVNAVLLPHKDLSFAGNLLWLEEGKPVRTLCDRVALANRPHVSGDGRIFVQRGFAGAALERVDRVSVDEVRADASTKTLLQFEGHAAFIAGQLGSELLIYRVLPQGRADLVAVHVDNLRVRTLVGQLTPLARDFSVDAKGRVLWFTNGPDWHLERVELESGALRAVGVEQATMGLLPTVFPGGRVALNAGEGKGLRWLEGGVAASPALDGVLRLRGFFGELGFGYDEQANGFDVPVVVRDGKTTALPTPANERLDVAGVLR